MHIPLQKTCRSPHPGLSAGTSSLSRPSGNPSKLCVRLGRPAPSQIAGRTCPFLRGCAGGGAYGWCRASLARLRCASQLPLIHRLRRWSTSRRAWSMRRFVSFLLASSATSRSCRRSKHPTAELQPWRRNGHSLCMAHSNLPPGRRGQKFGNSTRRVRFLRGVHSSQHHAQT